MDLPLPPRTNSPVEMQDAAVTTSPTPFSKPPTIAAPKSSAQRQREYRQRMAASRTPAQLKAMRISDTERKRNYRLRKAAKLARASCSLKSTTASSCRSAGRSNNVRNSARQHTQQQRQYLAADQQTTAQPDSTIEEVFIKSEPIEITIQPEIQLQNLECTVKIEPYEDDNTDYNAQDINYSSSFYNNSFKTEYSLNIQHNVPIEFQRTPHLDIIEKVYENGEINGPNCVQCDKTFKNRVNLQNHIKHVHTEHQIVECSECFRTFKSLQYLKSHMTSVHPKIEEVTCEHCQTVFMNRKKFNNHFKDTHQQPEPQVRRTVCSKTSHARSKDRMRHAHPEVSHGLSTDNIHIDDVPFSKCDEKNIKSEIQKHEDSCEGQPIFKVTIKTEVEDT